MINDRPVQLLDEESNDSQIIHTNYRKRSYIIYAILSAIIIVLSVLLVIFIVKSSEPEPHKCTDGFSFFNQTKITPDKQIGRAGEDIEINLSFLCQDGSYFEDYEDKNTNFTLKKENGELMSNYEIKPGARKGIVTLQIKYNKTQNYKFNLYQNDGIISKSPLEISVIPSDPHTYSLKDFQKVIYTGKKYRTEATLIDRYGNDVVNDNPYLIATKIEDFDYLLDAPVISGFSYTKFQLEKTSDNKKVIAVYYVRGDPYVNVYNYIFNITVKKEEYGSIQVEIDLVNPLYMTNILKLMDVKQSIFIFIDSYNFNIILKDASGIETEFDQNTEISIKGDKNSCEDLNMIIPKELITFKKVDSLHFAIPYVLLNEEIKKNLIKCQNYFIINFEFQSGSQKIPVNYYKSFDAEITVDGQIKTVSKLYAENFNTINDFTKIERIYYLRDVVYGLENPFNFTNFDTSDSNKVNAAVFFALMRIFDNSDILYYNVTEEINLAGEIYILTSRFNTLALSPNSAGILFKK